MNKSMKRRRNGAGATVLEVLIVLTIVGVVGMMVIQYYTARQQDKATEYVLQSRENARNSIDELARQIRLARDSLPAGLQSIRVSNTDPDTVTLTYLNDGCVTHLSESMPLSSSDLICTADNFCFAEGQWAFIYDSQSDEGEWFEISRVEPADGRIQHAGMTLSRIYDSGSTILSLSELKYYVDNTHSASPRLMLERKGRRPEIFAKAISDLQLQFRLADGTIVNHPPALYDCSEIIVTVAGHLPVDHQERRRQPAELPEYHASVPVSDSVR
jgi:type II secretory pathway pseudopilin PulG